MEGLNPLSAPANPPLAAVEASAAWSDRQMDSRRQLLQEGNKKKNVECVFQFKRHILLCVELRVLVPVLLAAVGDAGAVDAV